jgi:uncharacterized protein YecA (UPF0149 family)
VHKKGFLLNDLATLLHLAEKLDIQHLIDKWREDVEHEDCHPGCGHEQRVSPLKHAAKIRRNDPCPCGSGKKYKKCCLL